jgi:hypothetical protein
MINLSQDNMTLKQGEIDKEIRKKQQLERDLKTAKLELENKKADADDSQRVASSLQDEVRCLLSFMIMLLLLLLWLSCNLDELANCMNPVHKLTLHSTHHCY